VISCISFLEHQAATGRDPVQRGDYQVPVLGQVLPYRVLDHFAPPQLLVADEGPQYLTLGRTRSE